MAWKVTAFLVGGSTVEIEHTTEKKAKEAALDIATAGIEVPDGTGFVRYPPRRIVSITLEEVVVP
jgi:hypothetical protein